MGSASEQSATATDDASELTIDSVTVRGNMMDMMTQHIHVCAHNNADHDLSGQLYVVQDKGDGRYEAKRSWSVSVKAGNYMEAVIPIELPQGDHTLRLSADKDGQRLLGDAITMSIGPLRQLNMKVEFIPNMMHSQDGVNILTSHSLQGKLRVRNDDDVPYYGISEIMSQGSGIMWSLTGDNVEEPEPSALHHIASSLEPGQSVGCDFSFTYDFVEGEVYALNVIYTQPQGIVTIGSLTFTFQGGDNTYWTKDGQVMLLEAPVTPGPGAEQGQESSHLLVVPQEAVAVELRGQSLAEGTCSLDISQANPNCLYYIPQTANIPKGLSLQCNVVRDGKADAIRLTDDHDFYCPKAFQANYVSYTLRPNAPYGAYAETLVLPFPPQGAMLDDINASADQLIRTFLFLGYGADTLTIANIHAWEMQAYKPYIVAVGQPSPVTFFAQSAHLPVTTMAVTHSDNLDFVGGTVFNSPGPLPPLRYSPQQGLFAAQHGDGLLPPFRAWLNVHDASEEHTAGSGHHLPDYLRLDTGFIIGEAAEADESQGVSSPVASPSPSAVYSLSGIARHPGQLAKGTYIIGGKKVVVK